jgi:RNA polymerase sigma factor (sigma-70 family)
MQLDLLELRSKVLAQFAAGDLDAFETLFREFQGEVYGWVIRIVRDPAAAEDLTVETFWRIYRARARFDPGRGFGAWARRIATNVALDHLKAAGNRESQLTEDLPGQIQGDREDHNPAIQQEVRERAELAFRQLPAKLRVVAILALIEDRPHGEIAEALSISTGAVKSRLFRAIRLLRRKLGNLG